ncbi:MAG: MmcQ/YjbR family DNA-binding protein [Bacteroidales bacterium]|nr:MmcQ/YjbR family DNA-binding protein [Bacteroidales bacterium]
MDIEAVRLICISKQQVTEDMPFGDDTVVFRIGGKMFALLSLDGSNEINLKCNPEKAIEYREKYDFVKPGYHMNKRHWNSVCFDTTIPDSLLSDMINHSYQLVYEGLTRVVKESLGK